MKKKFITFLALSNLCLSSIFGNFYFHSNIQDKNQPKHSEQAFVAFQQSSYPKYLKEMAPVAFIPAVFYKSQQLLSTSTHELGHAAAITLQDEGMVTKLQVNWSGGGYCYYKPFYDLDFSFARQIPKQHLRKMLASDIAGPLAGATAAGLIGYASLNYIFNSNSLNDNQRTALFAPLVAITLNIGWKQLYYNLFAKEDLRNELYHTLDEKSDGTKALWNLDGINPKYADKFWRLSQKINSSNFAVPSSAKHCVLLGSLFSVGTYHLLGSLDKIKKQEKENRLKESRLSHLYSKNYTLACPTDSWEKNSNIQEDTHWIK